MARPQGAAYDVGAYEWAGSGGGGGGGGGGGTNARPSVTITAPGDGSSFLAGQSINISAAASDSDGLVTQVAWRSSPTVSCFLWIHRGPTTSSGQQRPPPAITCSRRLRLTIVPGREHRLTCASRSRPAAVAAGGYSLRTAPGCRPRARSLTTAAVCGPLPACRSCATASRPAVWAR